MALASEADVERALGRFLTEDEDVSLLLEEASDRVVAFLGYTPDPVPLEVARAVARMVERVVNQPHTTAADYGATGYNSSQQPLTYREQPGGDPWLKDSIKKVLRPFRQSNRKMFTVDLTPETTDG